MVVTGAGQDSVTTLGGRPAAEAARETILSLKENERQLVSNGLRLGLAVTEYQEHFGAHDFLVREITGVDENTGALQIAEPSSSSFGTRQVLNQTWTSRWTRSPWMKPPRSESSWPSRACEA
jgi:small ligand-binding sensory domain FIST